MPRPFHSRSGGSRSGDVSWEVDTDRLNRILRNLPGNRREAVKKVALQVETHAKINIQQQDLIDTGALLNSVYTWMGDEAAQLPQVPGDPVRAELPRPEDDATAHVGPSVEYGLYKELGTEREAARPFLLPAVNEAAAELERNPQLFAGVVTDE